ncbi:hypothetical protein [Yersinia aleksiciae]|uniref:hypothetical protein n=1 Tax=Yersinia aleksiciae TaxID=263819 RepID=UPI001427E6B4|nr:hypothetical protein [Yersinia aleksiciae]MDA5496924.1 hypothetical protein [Yersinia aleksiciae]NIK98694.1 hypothetical protein [Yersinia aleksiciae]WQC72390.1 hypothetical protein N0K21_08260 [Yersinia aleksiciae]
MKELDSFTVERLEEIRNSFLDRIQEKAPSIGEVFALIDIALAAKRAEPVAWKWRGAIGEIWTQEKRKADFVKEYCPELPVTELYTTPQLNSPEIPEGWKLVPIEPTLAMITLLGLTGSFESMLERYANMLDAAPENL